MDNLEDPTIPSPEQKKINTLNKGVLIWGAVIFAFCLLAAIYSVVSQLLAGEKIKPVPFSRASASAAPSASSR